MAAITMELPSHLHYVALEEMLLLRALENLLEPDDSPAAFLTMCTRNELICMAQKMLKGQRREQFLVYADQLAQAITAQTVVKLPVPVSEHGEGCSRAERLARDFLQEGQAPLWSAVREVARDLGYAADPRIISTGYIFRLGLYNKGGLVGLTSETKKHPCACRLINSLVIATLGTHKWTSLSVNLNCGTEVHKDHGNATETTLPSLLVGLSHHLDGQLRVESSTGNVFMEHYKDGFLCGNVYPTSAVATVFHGQQCFHATMPWSGGDRVVLLAYVARQYANAVAQYKGELEDLGFVMPRDSCS